MARLLAYWMVAVAVTAQALSGQSPDEPPDSADIWRMAASVYLGQAYSSGNVYLVGFREVDGDELIGRGAWPGRVLFHPWTRVRASTGTSTKRPEKPCFQTLPVPAILRWWRGC